jgi:hypothetical protein
MSFTPSPPPLPATPAYSPPPALTEYSYHSQFALDQLGIVVNVAGVPTNADNNAVSLSMVAVANPGTGSAASSSPVFTATATNSAPGVYTYTTTSANLSTVGYYTILWSFSLSGVSQVVQTWLQVGPPSPAYDALPPIARQVVEDVWAKFADSVDSAQGGPNLLQWMNVHFGRNRVAQLLYQCVQHLNNVAQPQSGFTADGNGGGLFPYVQWGGLINSALTVEVIKHLMRSYVEDPDITGNVQVRANRRDYLTRWAQMLPIEQEEYKAQRDVWKISQMFVMTPRVLVSGGAFGNWNRQVGFNLAQFPSFSGFYF